MATNNPRINTVLEPPVYKAVEYLAKREGVSLSQKVRDLIVEALELLEDEGLAYLAEKRLKSNGRKQSWIPLEEMERRLKRG